MGETIIDEMAASVMVEENRRYQRIKFNEPVQFGLTASQLNQGCLGCNISEGGLSVNCEEFLPLGSAIYMKMSLLPEKVTSLGGKVIWVQKYPHSDRYLVGLEFDNVSSAVSAYKDIQTYIKSPRY